MKIKLNNYDREVEAIKIIPQDFINDNRDILYRIYENEHPELQYGDFDVFETDAYYERERNTAKCIFIELVQEVWLLNE